jgi:hypothetical protein
MRSRTVESVQHTWTPEHPHANDRQWTVDGKVWKWTSCIDCGAKTAARVGAAGHPICDACFEVEQNR